MRSGNQLVGTLGLFAILACAVQSADAEWQLIDLGTPNGWGSCAYGMNEAGQVVGNAGPPSGLLHAFVWEGGSGMIDLGALGGYDDSQAMDVNGVGRVVGWGDGQVFLWDSESGFTELDLGPGYTSPSAINDADQVVGRSSPHAFLWESGSGMIDLGTLGGHGSRAHAINNVGQIVGGADLSDQPYTPIHAFLITPEGGVWNRDDDGDGANDLMVDLGTLPTHDHSQAYDINEAGNAVGWSYDSAFEHTRGFFYSNGIMEDLGTLGGERSHANALNDADQIVGKAQTAGGEWRPCLWDGGAVHDLNDLIPPGSGWDIIGAYAINSGGWIAGAGIAPNGEMHAILLVPEPAMLALLALSGLLIARRRR